MSTAADAWFCRLVRYAARKPPEMKVAITSAYWSRWDMGSVFRV
jgi:hypothetical protein